MLQELNAAGCFAAGLFADFRSMQLVLLQLALPNPVNVQLAAGDWLLGQDFVMPAGAGAAAPRTRLVQGHFAPGRQECRAEQSGA